MKKRHAYILVGGQSHRMGQNKALIYLNGERFVDRIARVVQPFVEEVFLVGAPEVYQDLAYTVIPDQWPGQGPLGGICTALAHSQVSENYILSCDIPFLQSKIFEAFPKQMPNPTALISETMGQWQPLCALYHKDIQATLQNALASGQRGLIATLHKVNPDILRIKSRDCVFLHNINQAKDWKDMAINIEIKYFGMFVDLCGKDSEDLLLERGATVQTLKESLLKLYPALADMQWQLAVNHQLSVEDSQEIKQADLLALLPPFAGG